MYFSHGHDHCKPEGENTEFFVCQEAKVPSTMRTKAKKLRDGTMRTKMTIMRDGTRTESNQSKSKSTSSSNGSTTTTLIPWDENRAMPAFWDNPIKAPKHIKDKCLDMAYNYAPQSHTYWDQIFQPIMIAAEYMNMLHEIHEIALPIYDQRVKAWTPSSTNWKLPVFRITTADMQGALCQQLGMLYDAVTKTQTRNTSKEFLPWTVVQSAWSGCASFFRTYWYAHSHLSKATAFRQAMEIGKAQVTSDRKRRSIQNSFLLDAKTTYYSGRINILLTTTLQKVVLKEDDGHASEDYFMYTNEEEAQLKLKAYFEVRNIKTGSYKDMIAFSKTWIQSENTSMEDKALYQQFLQIYSAREVGAKKKKTGKKRPRPSSAPGPSSVSDKIALSKMRILADRTRELQQAYDNNSNSIFLPKVSARWRKVLVLRMKKPPRTTRFRPISVLQVYKSHVHAKTQTDVFMWRIPAEGRPESELLHFLFAGEKDFRAEIPSLEGVDASFDRGNLKKRVLKCKAAISRIQNEPRFKCREVCRLKKCISQAWSSERSYRRLEASRIPRHCYVCELMVEEDAAEVCHECTRLIHRDCGYCFNDNPINCATCCNVKKNNPTLLSRDGKVHTDGGSNWKKLMLTKYVCVMNFVSTMLTDQEVANTFHAKAVPSTSLSVTKEASQVLTALAMHDLTFMGDKYIQGLESWLPPLYHPSCCAYLTIFYKISRAKGKQKKTINSICSKILQKYYTRGMQDVIKEYLSQVKKSKGADVVDEEANVAMALTNLKNQATDRSD
jgi:hypothetical protein